MGERVTSRELAKRWGVNTARIRHMRLQNGMPSEMNAAGNYEFDVEECEKWRAENIDKSYDAANDDTGGTLNEERAKAARVARELAEVKLARVRGDLLDRGKVLADVGSAFTATRIRLEQVPRQIVSEIAAACGLTAEQQAAATAIVKAKLESAVDDLHRSPIVQEAIGA